MDSQERTSLALQVIQWHFGPVCKQVAKELVGRIEYCSLSQLKRALCVASHDKKSLGRSGVALAREMRESEVETLSSATVREALLALMMHNLVQVIETPSGLRYRLSVSAVLRRLEYPIYLHLIRERFKGSGELAVNILKEVLVRGRATANDLLAAVEGDNAAATMQRLIREQYVISAETAKEKLKQSQPQQIYQKPPKKGADQFKDKEKEKERERERLEREAAQREKEAAAKKKGRGKNAAAAPPLPCFTDTLLGDDDPMEVDPAADNSLIVGDTEWTLNPSRFAEDMMSRDCGITALEKLDVGAEYLVRALFEYSRERMRLRAGWGSMPDIAEGEIVRRLLDDPERPFELDKEALIRKYLQHLAKETSPQFLARHQGANECSYSLNVAEIIRTRKLRTLEALVQAQLSQEALRIFRALVMHKKLEQKQLADLCLAPVEETRQHLYQLLEHDLVRIQEVARSSDHSNSRTHFLWSVNLPEVFELKADHVYKSIKNLIIRLDHDLPRARNPSELALRMHAAILDLVEVAAVLTNQADADLDHS